MNLHYLVTCGSMSAARGLTVIFVGIELGKFIGTNFFLSQLLHVGLHVAVRARVCVCARVMI
jgi:hypothetical protein